MEWCSEEFTDWLIENDVTINKVLHLGGTVCVSDCSYTDELVEITQYMSVKEIRAIFGDEAFPESDDEDDADADDHLIIDVIAQRPMRGLLIQFQRPSKLGRYLHHLYADSPSKVADLVIEAVRALGTKA